MKNFFTISLLVFLGASLYAQVPQGINFQAIARDGNGNLIVNSSLQIRLSVIDSAQAGTIVYQELRSQQTNAFGSFSFQIGINPASTTIGYFQNVNWNSGDKHLKIEYDPTNTSNFSLTLGVIKFVSVPYAFTSKNVVFIDASAAQNGDVLIYDSALGKFVPGQAGGTINWNDIQNKPNFSPVAVTGDYNSLLNKPANPMKILPRIATRGQKLSVSFSGGDDMIFTQAASSCPNAYANVQLMFNQGTPTIINPTDKYFIDTGRFDAVFDIPSYVPSGLWDIIIAPSTTCPYTFYNSFKIY